MLNLEKREKFILLVLLATLLIGMVIGLYQKRTAYIDVKPNSFVHSAEDGPTEPLKININESGAEDLMKLRGVGKVLAGRIIEYRKTSGRFVSVEDLKRVKGFGQKLYDRVKDEVSID
jgi:competence ComEA-like helix-hairpin-helix protein